MKSKIFTIAIIAIYSLLLSACNKEEKKYDGDPQLAFSEFQYEFNVTESSSNISIPIQLIASGWVKASGNYYN